MSNPSQSDWFTEQFGDEGTAFGLEITARLHHEQTRYQTLDVYQTKTFGRLMVLDGCVMLTSRDNFLYHEMMSHPALFTHPHPRQVAIVGGGDCGTLREVLKHPGVERCTQIDIDERVTWASQQWFPELCESNDDPRASLLFDDGIAWIKNCEPGALDAVIIDSTDPVGPAEGLFAVDFYRDCLRALAPEGILVQQSESPLLHSQSIIRKIHQDMAAAGFEHQHTLTFPQPVYPSGWGACTMASVKTPLTRFRERDVAEKSFATDYYNREIHLGALAQPEFMKRDLNS